MTGLYIHVPFCKRKCFYCDFISFNYDERKADDYIKALFKESRKYKKEKISTVYIGGGTPSMLSAHQLQTLIDGIKKHFDATEIEEFTFELNPESTTAEKLKLLYDNKISRISFGLQSSNDEELKILGRLHTYNQFLTAYSNAKNTGFDNISIDLMYGIETQSAESWQNTLDTVLKLNPDHISLYPLTIEKDTLFHKQNKKTDPDLQAIMYNTACEKLKDAGFTHYEISNWAKDGKFSKHNTLYWKNQEYIGLGASASSYYKRQRYKNILNADIYIKNLLCGESYVLESEIIDDSLYETETIMLGLRLSEGVDLSLFNHKQQTLYKYLKQDLLVIRDGKVCLTEKGFWVSNAIISDFM